MSIILHCFFGFLDFLLFFGGGKHKTYRIVFMDLPILYTSSFLIGFKFLCPSSLILSGTVHGDGRRGDMGLLDVSADGESQPTWAFLPVSP